MSSRDQCVAKATRFFTFTASSRRSRAVLAAVVAGSAALVSSANAQLINEDLKFVSNDGVADDRFGGAVAIDNGVVAVGAYGDDDNGQRSGSAYLFDAVTGSQTAKLVANDGISFDYFGQAIAIGSGVVAVGAINGDGIAGNSGAVYLFDATTGAPLFKLFANDGATNELFGMSVAIGSGVIAVGAPWDNATAQAGGSVYLFDLGSFAQTHKLLANDGAAFHQFGWSVDVNSGVVAVGAWGDTVNGTSSGAAYLFNAVTGLPIHKLVPNDGSQADEFGRSIAIEGNTVAVGAWQGDGLSFNTGSVYLFNATTGAQTDELFADDGTQGNAFGDTIGLSNGILAVGAHRKSDNGNWSGAGYLFDAINGCQLTKLLPSDGAADDNFGFSIDIDGGTIASGTQLDDDNGLDSGSAYVFTYCRADLNGDKVVDNGDIGAFITLFLSQNPLVDFNCDGVVDNGDIGLFITLFLAGC
ncbi:MAG: hypothetical protein ACI89L_000446 [Phycisphaerales bacterium]|jgi:hypothetical protein